MANADILVLVMILGGKLSVFYHHDVSCGFFFIVLRNFPSNYSFYPERVLGFVKCYSYPV